MNPLFEFLYTLVTGKVNCTGLRWHEKRRLLEELMGTGRISTITYKEKTTGLVVTRKAKLWVESYLTSGNKDIVGVNIPASLDPDLFPYADLNKKAFRSFSINNLIELKTGGNTYKFSFA